MWLEMNVKGLALEPLSNMPMIILHDEEDKRSLPICLKASRHTQGRTSASRLVLPALHITAAEHTNRAFVITSEVTNRISRSARPWHPAGKSMCRSEPNATRLRVREELRGRSHNELV